MDRPNMRQAKYRTSTQPISRHDRSVRHSSIPALSGNAAAKDNWRRARVVAQRAGSDDTSETDGEEGMTAEQLEDFRRKKREAKTNRERIAKTMGLDYFLEMAGYDVHPRIYAF